MLGFSGPVYTRMPVRVLTGCIGQISSVPRAQSRQELHTVTHRSPSFATTGFLHSCLGPAETRLPPSFKDVQLGRVPHIASPVYGGAE